MDFVARLANRYNGGWAAAMRCAKHALPDLDWSQVEEAHGRRDFELPVEGEVLDFRVTEADIANADPRFMFKEVQGLDFDNTAAVTKDPIVVVDDPETEESENMT